MTTRPLSEVDEEDAFIEDLARPDASWGSGISSKMLADLEEDGWYMDETTGAMIYAPELDL